MKKRTVIEHIGWLTLALAIPTVAQAHSGAGEATGLLHGLAHPLTGLDHLLAMVAVGLWAFYAGGRARWALPLTFVALLAIGAALAVNGVLLPAIEPMILLSVVALGGLIAVGVRMPVIAGSALVGLFGLFHGFAHGAALPVAGTALGFGAGFVATSALLHLAGIGLAAALLRGRPLYLKLAGGAVAASGLVMGVL